MQSINIRRIWVCTLWLLILPTVVSAQDGTGSPKSNVPPAIIALLNTAREYYNNKDFEQAANTLERALRLDDRNPILLHNLAGVRLQQQEWKRAGNLAAKSNSYAVHDKMLRVRNFVIIALACDGLGDKACAARARKEAVASAN